MLSGNPLIDLSLLKKVWKSNSIESEIRQMDTVVQGNPLLDETLRIRKAALAVIDIRTMQYLRIFGDPSIVTGWASDKFLEGGVIFFMSKLPQQDYAGVEKMSALLNMHVPNIDDSDITSFKAFFDFRMIGPDGTSRRVLHESSSLWRDESGNILFLLGMISDISHLKRRDKQHLCLSHKDHNLIYEFDSVTGTINKLEDLSQREFEIVRMIGGKLTSKQIAHEFSISNHTVNTHRQNILRKLNMVDMMEVVNFLSAYQIL